MVQVVDKKAKISMRFTKPLDATGVEIRFFETDTWVSNGKEIKESDAKPTLIGTIGGLVQHGVFKQNSQAIPFPPDKINALLTVDIDGELITMPMPNVDNEKELDFFEVTYKITGQVGGKAEAYEPTTPVFVRRTSTPRAEVAFITGDRNDFPDDPPTIAYFDLASQFWSQLKDNKSNERTIAGIINFLKDKDDKIVRSRNNLPWGRINIVSHGNDSTWFIRPHLGDVDFEALEADDLEKVQLGVPPPTNKEVDDHTEIIIRGCELGNDVKLLNAIRDKFGGLATVFAPKFTNTYRREDSVVRDRLFQSWVFSLPGQQDFPPAAQIVSVLKKKYAGHPLYGSFTDADWTQVAQINGTFAGSTPAFRQRLTIRRPNDRNDTVSAQFDKEEVIPGGKQKSQTELTALMRKQMEEEIDPTEFDRFAWTWNVSAVKKSNPPLVEVAGRGVRTSFEIYRLLTKEEDGKRVPVTPNHLNPDLFGKSS